MCSNVYTNNRKSIENYLCCNVIYEYHVVALSLYAFEGGLCGSSSVDQLR